jgi:hypothetical protein
LGDLAEAGAVIYRDLINDPCQPPIGGECAPGDFGLGIEADLSTITIPANLGVDIRLVNEFLWFADPDNRRADLVQFPCGYGRKLERLKFTIVSIPCELDPNATVEDVFGAALKSSEDVYGNAVEGEDYTVWELDPARSARGDRRPYRRLGSTDEVQQGKAYWLIALYEQYFSIPSQVSTQFTTSGVAPPSVSQDSKVKKVFPVLTRVDSGFELIPNPFTRSFGWNDIGWRTVSGTLHDQTPLEGDLGDAEAAGVLESTIYVFRPEFGTGNGYVAISDPNGTPGFPNKVRPYEGFFIRTLVDQAFATSELEIPFTE